MGFDHMALVRQNTPYIVKGGDFQRLDLDLLLLIAEKLPMSTTTYEWFMPMEEIKEALRMRPETWSQSIDLHADTLVGLGFLKVRNGTGKQASTYGLTAKLMKGHVAPERQSAKAANGSGAAGGKFTCRCKGKSHTNKGACAVFQTRKRNGRPERAKGKKPKTGRSNPCTCPGKDHKTDGACDTWRWRHKDQVMESPSPATPAPAPEPPTEAELQAKAERQAERQRAREEREAEAQRIEDARHKCLCPGGPYTDHQEFDACKRCYPFRYNDDGSLADLDDL